ncbi:hypothetical protein V5O48_000637 [Marasmius crinis-equi]|uniref:GH16 domain-containing protein n=1 Tax=Marasmius crinis-equi TaxID=585013 RepID=A0ABR3G0Q7_9AGAR
MKLIPHSLPLHLLLLLDACLILHVSARHSPEGGSNNIFSRAVHRARRHSKGLADDLRVAFGAVLVSTPIGSGAGSGSGNRSGLKLLSSRDQAVLGNPVVYCKSGGSRDSDGSSSGGDGGSSGGSSSGGGSSGSGTSTISGGSGGHFTNSTTSRGAPSSSGGGGGGSTRTSATASAGPTSTVSSPFKIVSSHSGNDFFNGWNFWTLPDPTEGIVDYVDEATARSNGLLEVNSAGNAIMRVETTSQVSANRKSVRIQTQLEIDKGLWILDAVHVPSGCGTWPAFWTNGPSWPFDGEFDIMEGVHDYTNNQATLHTDAGCTLSTNDPNKLGIAGTVVTTTNCGVTGADNAGCGIRSDSSVTYGSGFNKNGGGVYAGLIDDDGTTVWFFPRNSIPSDINSETPLPSSWGTPMARWGSSSCNPSRYFNNQAAIFTSTLCGQWAGGVWGVAGIPGQDQSCAQRTGVSTCEEYVRKNGGAFSEAYWEVKSVKIYQRK